jgi:hypothetical protein
VIDKDKLQSWLEALRSGKYKQGTQGALNDETGGFCCLGVLCDVHGEEPWREEGVGELSYLSCCYFLPDKVSEWFLGEEPGTEDFERREYLGIRIPFSRLEDSEIKLLKGSNTSEAVENFREQGAPIHMLNDVGVSFSRLADLIEGFFNQQENTERTTT